MARKGQGQIINFPNANLQIALVLILLLLFIVIYKKLAIIKDFG